MCKNILYWRRSVFILGAWADMTLTCDGWQIITSHHWDREGGIILMSFCSCLIRYSGHSNQLPVSFIHTIQAVCSLCKINPRWNVWWPLLRDEGELIFVLMTPGWAGVSLSVSWHWRHFPCCPALACSWSTQPAPALSQSPSGSLRDNSWPAELPAPASGYQQPEVFPDNTW